MPRIFAIGDIHGCNDAFQRMLFAEIKITKTDQIFCIGDYIDRGPDSKGVIDTILSLRDSGYHIHTLRGNHEQMMMESEISETNFEHWYIHGGKATLKSFDIDIYSDMPLKYKRFFWNTRYCMTTGSFIFVHAGLNFSRPDLFEDKEAMLWARGFEPNQTVLGNRILIHGHTALQLPTILFQKGNCINIDGGCVYTGEPGYGNLIGVSLPGKEFIVVGNGN